MVFEKQLGNNSKNKYSSYSSKKYSNPKNPGGITSAKVELETIPAQKPSEFTPSKMTGTFMFVGNTGPSETSIRYAKLTDPSNVSYDISGKNINLSWTSPGTPNAIDTTYLTDYFNKYWKNVIKNFYWTKNK